MVVRWLQLAILLIGFLPVHGYSATFVADESAAAQVVGRESVLKTMKQHKEHLEKTGIGLFYGSQSAYSPIKKVRSERDRVWSDIDRFNYLKTVIKQDFVQILGTTSAVDSYLQSLVGVQDEEPRRGDLEMTSSVLWALKHVMAAYTAAEKKERAEQISRIVLGKGTRGSVLMEELQKDGWHAIYWNPDVYHPAESDPAKSAVHTRSWVEASNGSYMNGRFKVDYTLVNYRPSPGSTTKKTRASLLKLKRVPFWIGMANNGKHLFVGYQTHLSEAFGSELPVSDRLIKESQFETWHGHFKKEKLLSGLILVPPGSLL